MTRVLMYLVIGTMVGSATHAAPAARRASKPPPDVPAPAAAGQTSGAQDKKPAADDAPAAAAESDSLLEMYATGGPLMHPILLCSIGTLAVCVYCVLHIGTRRMAPPSQLQMLGHLLSQGDVTAAYDLCRAAPSLLSSALGAALLKLGLEGDAANRASMDQAAGDLLAAEETRHMLWINYLNVFATIAPMLGLLGTVTGMIEAFGQLAVGKTEPGDLAGGIGEAMITTAGGLIVGIPAMFFYFLFRNRLTAIVSAAQRGVDGLLDTLAGAWRDGAGQAAAGDTPHEPG